MKQIKMNYSPGPPSHPLTSKRGMRSLCLRPAEGSRGSGGQIKALWTRFTAVLVVHLGAVERKTVPTGGLWLLEARGWSVSASRSLRRARGRGRGGGGGAGEQGFGAGGLDAPTRPAGRIGSACAETELLFRGNQSIRRKQKWKSRLGKTCHFPDLSGAGWGRRLGRLKRGPYSHLSAFPRTPRRENDPPHLPFPTHPGSPFSPFLHLLFPSSENSLVPELPESVPSPLPLPRGSPPPPSHRYCHHLGSTQSIFAAGQHLLPQSPLQAVLGRNLYLRSFGEMRPGVFCAAVPEKSVEQHMEHDLEPRLMVTWFGGTSSVLLSINNPAHSTLLLWADIWVGLLHPDET
ncbi:uncharacterized protein LOC133071585 [Dama dama]|uniref:uncharacterized protein LOC133071585 n=1 Tax=Dama dama TaxID=30532 RepID=UPI002A35EF8F|nr:uncharacterized protein LOC133071585 [Dama dama]